MFTRNYLGISLGKRRKKNKSSVRVKKGDDRLSELPDSLILYILSLLGDLKEVIRSTCLLSKRWQFLWTNMSEIELYESSEDEHKISSYVNNVERVLDICNINYLHKFSVGFHYDEWFASNLNSWLQIAVERNVKDISLTRYGWHYGFNRCELPHILYSLISSLTTLSVCGWIISPRETINWQSLKSLSISDANLSDGAMEKLLSGCPVLEVLHLKQCGGFYCLNIFSSNFTKLEIERCDYPWGTIEISAPYARELKIEYEYAPRDDKISQFRLRDMTSLVRASLDFNYVSVPQIHIIELLQSLQYVKKLVLGDGCFASLAELDGLNYIPPSTRQCLTLNIRHEVSFPGILFIFKSSPYLETLTIQGDFDYFEGIPEEETSEEEILELCIPEQIVKYIENIDLVFHHLKTINITCYDCESMMILAQLLLKSSNVLQKMNLFYSGEECCEELSRTVLALPKASPEAIVTVVNHW